MMKYDIVLILESFILLIGMVLLFLYLFVYLRIFSLKLFVDDEVDISKVPMKSYIKINDNGVQNDKGKI